jgi:Mg/Co/Ni transporter MgtE
MLDFFKVYATEAGTGALLGDSFLVIMAVILSAFLNQSSYDTNIVLLIMGVYLAPYFAYMKD